MTGTVDRENSGWKTGKQMAVVLLLGLSLCLAAEAQDGQGTSTKASDWWSLAVAVFIAYGGLVKGYVELRNKIAKIELAVGDFSEKMSLKQQNEELHEQNNELRKQNEALKAAVGEFSEQDELRSLKEQNKALQSQVSRLQDTVGRDFQQGNSVRNLLIDIRNQFPDSGTENWPDS